MHSREHASRPIPTAPKPGRHADNRGAAATELRQGVKRKLAGRVLGGLVTGGLALTGQGWAALPSSASFVPGQPAITTSLSCVTGSATFNTSSFVSASRPAPNTPPRVGEVFYASVIVSLLDGGCGNLQFGVQVQPPAGTQFVNTAEDQPHCFLLDANNQRREINCSNAGSLPAQLPGGGSSANFEFVTPLRATQAVNAGLSARVQLAQGGSFNGVVTPSLGLVVNAAVQPPPAPTITYPNPSTTNISSTSAALNGTVVNQGLAGTAFFDFGTTTSYGTTSAANAIPGSGNAFNLSIPFTNLTPGTIFHWRLRFVPTAGQAINGADQTFTTTGSTPPTSRSLTISRNGSGSVTSNPAGISCPSTCSGSFANGSSVTLNAVPASGFSFTGFSGACSGQTCTVTMSADRAVTANFAPQAAQGFRVTVARQGSGRVVDLGGIINCRDGTLNVVCSSSFAAGSTVKLRAIPDAGSSFVDWDGACDGPNPDCDLVMNGDATVTAKFAIQAAPPVTPVPPVNPAPVIPPTPPSGLALVIEPGAANPAQGTARKAQPGVPALQLRLVAGSQESIRVSSLNLEANGTGHDALDIAAAAVVLDANGNGRADAGETELARGRFSNDNGSLSLGLNAPVTVPAGQVRHLLVTLDFNGALAARSLVPGLSLSVLALGLALRRQSRWGLAVLLGSSLWLAGCQQTQAPQVPIVVETRTYQVRLTAATAAGISSGGIPSLSGLPMSGGVISVQK